MNNKNRLIDKQELIQCLKNLAELSLKDVFSLQVLEELIKAFQPPDSEMIKCVDCASVEKTDDFELWCGRMHPMHLVAPDEFCSHGRRKI